MLTGLSAGTLARCAGALRPLLGHRFGPPAPATAAVAALAPARPPPLGPTAALGTIAALGPIPPLGPIALGPLTLRTLPLRTLPLRTLALGTVALRAVFPIGPLALRTVTLGALAIGTLPLRTLTLGTLPLGPLALRTLPLGPGRTAALRPPLAGAIDQLGYVALSLPGLPLGPLALGTGRTAPLRPPLTGAVYQLGDAVARVVLGALLALGTLPLGTLARSLGGPLRALPLGPGRRTGVFGLSRRFFHLVGHPLGILFINPGHMAGRLNAHSL